MTTLAVLVCLVLGSVISARAAEPTGHGHLTAAVHVGDDGRAPDVQPGNKYFVSEASVVKIPCMLPDGGKKSDHPPDRTWFKVDTTDWSTHEVDSGSGAPSHMLVLTRVKVADAGRYDCVASHTFGNLSIELFVSSDSTAAERHGPLNANESLTLTCKADNPEWTLNGLPINEEKVKKEGKELKIDAPVRGDRTGVYMCSATGEGVAQIQMFHVVGAPVESKEVSKNLMEGERAVFKCEGATYPVAAVKWQREDSNGELKDLKPSDSKEDKIEFSYFNGIKDAILTVSDLEFTDAGKYVCTASNEFGSASHKTDLRVKDKLAALWPFLGIVVEVIVLVAIIFIYERRQSSKDQPTVDDEEDDEEQKKALTSGDAVDVRQRGAKS